MMDLVLEAWVSGLIELAKVQWLLGGGHSWKPGTKLKLFFAGYNGTRNTGSDVRVDEMLRQVRRVLGEDNIDLSVLTQNFDLSRGYFGDATQVFLPDVFPPMLRSEVPKHDGVIACEGSMFKSKFSNALTVMFIGALGIASAQNKLSLGYGAEAGVMDSSVEQMCRRYCKESTVITRNPESQEILGKLGIATELGTDTAWTFEPLGPEYARKTLQDAGWDGKSTVLAVCPINPFWWPVKPSLTKWFAHSAFGAYKNSHYRTMYFHRSGRDVDAAYEKYLTSIADGVRPYGKERNAFVVLVGMEMLDRDACERVSAKLGGCPIFSSDTYNMYELVGILRGADRVLSSRFHAIVTSMPGGVPSAGVTMDERIRNLMKERQHEHLLMRVDEPELSDKIFIALRALDEQQEEIRDTIATAVARNLRMMARMGMYLEEQVARRFPEFPLRTGMRGWEEYLPPLSTQLCDLLESRSGVSTA